jgi:hypothetical protein
VADDARISTAFPRHPKTVKLQRRLQERGCWALVCLFLWVADNRPHGNLTSMTAEDIEIAAAWAGEPGAFVSTLREIGFLDGEEGAFSIHDWAEHNPWAATRNKRVEYAKRAAAARWEHKENAVDMSEASYPHAERMRDVQKRNALLSSPPNQVKRSCLPAADPTTSKASEVVETWNRTVEGTTLPPARLTENRLKVIHARLKEHGWLEDFTAACAFVRESDFHRGQNDRDWVANLDYMLQAGKATELAEKAKAASKPNGKASGTSSALDYQAELLRQADSGVQQ